MSDVSVPPWLTRETIEAVKRQKIESLAFVALTDEPLATELLDRWDFVIAEMERQVSAQEAREASRV